MSPAPDARVLNTSAIGSASARARAVGTTPFGTQQEAGFVEQAPQPRQSMADSRGREVEPQRGATDVALAEDHLKQCKQVEIDAGRDEFLSA